MPGRAHFNRHKYKASPPGERTYNGKTYDSKAECMYARTLWELLGSVYLEVLEQPRLWLGVRENVYVPDFFVIRADGAAYYVDVKGMETAAFKKNLKLYHRYGRLPLHIVKLKPRGFETTEIVEPRAEVPEPVGPLFEGGQG